MIKKTNIFKFTLLTFSNLQCTQKKINNIGNLKFGYIIKIKITKDMKKEFITLTILSTTLLLFYFLFPDLQENIKKSEKVYSDDQLLDNDFEKNKSYQDFNHPSLTFDLVRISKNGDVVMAGKSEPNEVIELLDGQEILAELVSDANGDWIWIKDSPLKNGIKKFKLNYKDNTRNKNKSDQMIIVLIDNKTKPKVARLSNSDVKNIDVLNLENISDGITLDVLSYSPTGLVILSGRTLPNNELNILKAKKNIGKTQSGEDGKWKFILEEHNLSDQKLSIKTNINGEDVILSYNQAELKKRFVNKNFEFVNKKIVVQQGNSLWRIARKTLGGGIFYTEIYKNNFQKIKNPNLIYPGQVFNIPKKPKKTFYE